MQTPQPILRLHPKPLSLGLNSAVLKTAATGGTNEISFKAEGKVTTTTLLSTSSTTSVLATSSTTTTNGDPRASCTVSTPMAAIPTTVPMATTRMPTSESLTTQRAVMCTAASPIAAPQMPTSATPIATSDTPAESLTALSSAGVTTTTAPIVRMIGSSVSHEPKPLTSLTTSSKSVIRTGGETKTNIIAPKPTSTPETTPYYTMKSVLEKAEEEESDTFDNKAVLSDEIPKLHLPADNTVVVRRKSPHVWTETIFLTGTWIETAK